MRPGSPASLDALARQQERIDALTPAPPVDVIHRPWLQELTLRMLGDNITLTRSSWIELLEDLKPESALASRIRAMLADPHLAG